MQSAPSSPAHPAPSPGLQSACRQEEQFWLGADGRAYTARNPHELHPGRVRFFQEHVLPLAPESILEIGCNTGDNLQALTVPGPVAPRACSTVTGGIHPPIRPLLTGLDLEWTALRQLRAARPDLPVARGSLFDLPFADHSFELVMTVAVLIHMSPANLPRALDEIYRVSRRYILSHEYFAPTETDIPWHGRSGVLFKRDFLACWLQRYPALRLIDTGYRGPEDGFDRMTFWILEK